MVAWSIELSEYDIQFIPRGSIKSQVLADFLVELTSLIQETVSFVWLLSVDGSSNLKGSGAGIILEGPDDLLIEQSLKFGFKANNNQAEYEALIAGTSLALEMGADNLRARSDSQLMTSQITGEYQTKDTQLVKYLASVKKLAENFKFFKAIFVPREQNGRADILAKLTSTKKHGNNRTVIHEVLTEPSTEAMTIQLIVDEDGGWMTPLIRYLMGSFVAKNEEEDALERRRTSKFTMVVGKLYKRGRVTPLLRCLGESETNLVLLEVHEGVCGSHIGGRALSAKLLRAGYFRPTMPPRLCRIRQEM